MGLPSTTPLPLFTGTFSVEQTKQLLTAINPRRVQNAQGQSYVAGHDVIAHLIRVFGFGNFSFELLEQTLLYEDVRPYSKEGTVQVGSGQNKREVDATQAPHTWRYDVAYAATMRLTVFDREHRLVTFFDDSSTGDASNQTRADAHDLALKSAITLAKKRCAVHLGDQFGLSLYNKGQQTALVLDTIVKPHKWDGDETVTDDVQDGIEPIVGTGIDEVEKGAEPDEDQREQINHSLGAAPKDAPEFQRGHEQDEPHAPEDAK